MFHKNVIPADNHSIISWVVADNAALLALTPTVDDIGKVARQVDTGTFFILVDESPVTWKSISSPAAGDLNIVDSGGYYTGTTVEAALQEIGAKFGNIDKQVVEVIPVACSDETTNLTTGLAKVSFHMPYNFTLTEIFAGLTVAQPSGAGFRADVNKGGVSLFTTPLYIDNTELTSLTATTAAVLAANPTTLLKGDLITVDIDVVGDPGAKGLKVYLLGKITP